MQKNYRKKLAKFNIPNIYIVPIESHLKSENNKIYKISS